MGRKRTSHQFNEAIEKIVTDIIVQQEYKVAEQNQAGEIGDFETYIDLFDAERTEKEYDWMSDIFIPEFPSHMLTQSSIDVAQYFQTRDFVEVYIQDPSEEALKSADAAEELINRTLNRRELCHYQKFVRAKNINHLAGHVYLHCWWEQETDGEKIVKDHFNYEVLDSRNVFTDNIYTYSIQEKEWIIIRAEKTLERLKQTARQNGYFNLHLLEDHIKEPQDTETKRKTRDTEEPTVSYKNKISEKIDLLTRYGLFWIMEDGSPGLDKSGEIKKDARLRKCVITTVLTGGSEFLIGFHETPYIDATGNPYFPVIRGLCYIHPVKDSGIGDGKYARELQVGINDTFNVSNDRTMLATLPTLKGNKQAVEDTDTIYFEPGHTMQLNDIKDLEEFKIEDNIQGALSQIGILTSKMQQTTAIFPTTMGDIPGDASTTATAIVGAEQRTGKRTNYKSMTFEYTCLTELYWMIQQMTWDFAYPETGEKLMGEKIYDFNPALDFFYKPLSQSIETEASKDAKIRHWTTILGYVIQINAPELINYALSQIILLMGDEYANFGNALLNPQEPVTPVESLQSPEAGGEGQGPSNQYGVGQSNMEVMARDGFE